MDWLATSLRRRAFVGGLAGLTFVAGCQVLPSSPLGARIVRVGYLAGSGPGQAAFDASYNLFRSSLAEYGWAEGRNLKLDVRSANGNLELLPNLAAELVNLPLDVIATSGANAAVEAKRATSTLPIVAIATSDMVALGLVESAARPSGNVTGVPVGVSGTTLQVKLLELLKSIVLGLDRVAVVTNVGSAAAAANYPLIATAARSVGIDPLRLEVRTSDDLGPVVDEARAKGAQALLAHVDGSLINSNAQKIAALALQAGLPSVSSFKVPFAEAGFMMTYGTDPVATHGRAAHFVDRILRGAKPADLPIEEPRTFQLVVNVKTVQALSLTIPPDLAAQVTEWV